MRLACAIVSMLGMLLPAAALRADPGPTGACCFPDTTCQDLTEFDCSNAGGFWLDDVPCEKVSCPALGACCFESSCVVAMQIDCEENLEGTWFGGQTCLEACTGACCVDQINCIETTEFGCALFQGAFQRVGVPCDQFVCDATVGACCIELEGELTCIELTFDECVSGDGIYLGDFVPCNINPCVVGACCVEEKITYCEEMTIFECVEFYYGTFFGPGTTCGENSCAFGACCLTSNTCIETYDIECEIVQGQFLGDGTSCQECVAVGACCMPLGQCDDLSLDDCAALGGTWQGESSACVQLSCEDDVPLGNPQEFALDGEPVIGEVGDFNLDQFDDMAMVIPAASGAVGAVQVLLNEGNDIDGWIGYETLPAIPVGIDPTGVAIGLLNGDEFPDLAVSNAGDDTVTILLGDGTGAFPTVFTLTDPGLDMPTGIAAADLDDDGLTDLAVTNSGNDTVLILKNEGFSPAGVGFGGLQVIGVPGGPTIIDPEDIDNDKDIDLIVTSAPENKLSILRNLTTLGPGDLFDDPPAELPAGTNPVDIALADCDNNGLPDILIANRGDDEVKIILNVDGLSFNLGLPPLPVGSEPRSVEGGDFDADGDKDIAVVATTDSFGDALQILANLLEQGSTGFAPPVDEDILASARWVVVGDINLDGIIDPATCNANSGIVPGSVTVLLSAATPPESCPADLNGDGVVDFADLVIVYLASGPCDGCPEDLNGDGQVDPLDYLIVIAAFGECPNVCGSDLNGDGGVDVTDLLILLADFGDCPAGGACMSDLNGDGTVGLADLLIMLVNWGACA